MEYFVFKELFQKEICKGLDYKYVEKVCVKHGLIMPEVGGNPTRSERIPGLDKDKARVYRFTPKVLFSEFEQK